MKTILTYIFLIIISVVFFACNKHDENLVNPTANISPLQKMGGGKSSLDLIEDDYANGLVDKDNANKYREYAVSAPEKLPAKYQSAEKGKDATYSMLQMAKEWSQLSRSTKQEILDLRLEGCSPKEIVQTTGRSERTVFRALDKIKRVLQRLREEENL